MSSFKDRIVKSISNYGNYILWTITSLLFFFLIFHIVSSSTKSTHGFASYYTASRLFLDGENISNFYNDDWFSSKVAEYVPGVYEIYLVNMPTTVFITLPVSLFEYKTARIIWITINFLLLIFTVVLLVKKLKLHSRWLPLILIIILAFQPLYANFSYAQVYILIFSLMVFVWFAYVSDNQKLLGVLLGLLFMLKTAGVLICLLLVIQKKWKSLIWIMITVVGTFLITIPFVGIESWLAYGDRVIGHSSNPTLAVTAYQTIYSFFHHLFMFDENWNLYPIADIPALATSLTIIFSLVILIIIGFSAVKSNMQELTFASFIVAGTILNPASIDYHFVLLLIPIIISIELVRKKPSGFLWILFFISYTLIALKLPYTSSKITKGMTAILAYPKLYGAIGLLILCLLLSYSSKNKERGT